MFLTHVLIRLWQCSVHYEEDIRAKAIRLVRKLVPFFLTWFLLTAGTVILIYIF